MGWGLLIRDGFNIYEVGRVMEFLLNIDYVLSIFIIIFVNFYKYLNSLIVYLRLLEICGVGYWI